jgi:arginyl-tRNA--protein-N-Asp/Glu arginylyltransferase
MTSEKDEEYFACLKVSPAQMDFLWAEGWRHFGIYFFRYQTSFHGDKKFSVMPLRIDLRRFSLTRSQKRVLAKNRDARIVIRPAAADQGKHDLFDKHRVRFKDNIAASLEDIVSPMPASVPCPSRELCVYLGARLVGATYLDLGQNATSAVYAVFDPAEAKRSLGILMILHSIQFSRERRCHYYYPGYAYHEPFAYDYKKRFKGLQYLDWASGWRPYEHGGNPDAEL